MYRFVQIHTEHFTNMIVVLIYYLIFQNCLQNVSLQQDDNQQPEASLVLENRTQKSDKERHESNGSPEKVDDGNHENQNQQESSTLAPSHDEDDEHDEPLVLKLLTRLLKVKGGFDDGVDGASKVFGSVHNIGDGLLGMFKDGARKIGTLLPF